MTVLKHQSWPPYITGIFLGLLHLPLYVMLNKTLNGSGGYTVIADGLMMLFAFDVSQEITSTITWWSIVLLVGIMIGAFISARMSKREKRLYAKCWQKKDNYQSFLRRAMLGIAGGYCLILGSRFAGDGTNFEEFASIAKLQFHSIITLGIIFIVGLFVTRKLYRLMD